MFRHANCPSDSGSTHSVSFPSSAGAWLRWGRHVRTQLIAIAAWTTCALSVGALPTPALADLQVDWATITESMGGADACNAVTMDAGGNSYVAGFVTDPMRAEEVFVSKYDPAGALLWSFTGMGAATDIAHDVAVDEDGNVYIVGEFSSPNIQLGTGVIANLGVTDVFIAKYDPNGVPLWSFGWGGAAEDVGMSIDVDVNGDVSITGWFFGNANFGGGAMASFGGADVFIAKYDDAGVNQWQLHAGGGVDDFGRALVTDSAGDVLITGEFNGVANFGGAGGAIASFGFNDVFVAKYGATLGAPMWNFRSGGPAFDIGRGIDIDAVGNVIVTGTFQGAAADFGSGALAWAGGTDVFVAKYDPFGAPLWSKSMGGAGADVGADVSVDSGNDILLAGSFELTADFSGVTLSSVGGTDVFSCFLDESAGLLCANSVGSVLDDHGLGAYVHDDGTIDVVGDFQDALTLAGGTITLTAIGGSDGFLLQGGLVAASAPSSGIADLPSGISTASPNPFRSATELRWQLPDSSIGAKGRLLVYDALGRRVRTLFAGTLAEPGMVVRWDGRNDQGSLVAAGVYLVKLHAEGLSNSQRVAVVR